MIPADLASRTQVSADTTLRPVAPTQEISDKLSGLTAGQRVMAEIQAMLPNGTYRAMINQRNITLALPFSAKSGDSLELMVTENDGKLALAVLTRAGAEGKATPESAATTLSRAGQLIGELFANARGAKEGGSAVPLNASRPILSAPPGSAALRLHYVHRLAKAWRADVHLLRLGQSTDAFQWFPPGVQCQIESTVVDRY